MNKRVYELLETISKDIIDHHIRTERNENLVFSPVSILMLLSMLADSTNGKTKEELLDFLSDGSSDTLDNIILSVDNVLLKAKGIFSANAAAVREDIGNTIKGSYIDLLRRKYAGELFISEDLTRNVNNWVSKQTKGMINQIMDSDSADILSVLMNAVAFDAEWKEQYEEDDIFNEEFTNADHTISDVCMLSSSENGYIENEDFTGFVKPYKRDFCFVALLPKSKGQVAFIKSLPSLSIETLKKCFSPVDVYVELPEYKSDEEMELLPYLERKGITQLFTDQADFSPMSTQQLKVEKIKHKAYVEVDRKGTKASAVTAAFIEVGAAPNLDIKYVYLDRPFLYAIVHKASLIPVFVGLQNHI